MRLFLARQRGAAMRYASDFLWSTEGPGVRRDYLTIGALAFLSILTVGMLIRLWLNSLYPYPIDNGEGCILGAAWHSACGKPIYGYVDAPPYHFNVYTPLLLYVGGLTMRLWGATPLPMRILSSLFLIGAAAMIFLFVRRYTASWKAGLVAGLFLFVERHYFARAPYAVTDFPAIFFSLLGLYLWTGADKSKYWALAAFALAFFSKQNAVIAPAAALLALFLEGRRVQSLRLAGLYCAFLAAGFGVCYAVFGRAFFTDVLMYVGVADFKFGVGAQRVADTAMLCIAPFAAWVIYATVAWRDKRLLLPVLYTLFGFLSAFTNGRDGASRSYMFDFVAGLSIMLGLMWPAAMRRAKTARFVPPVLLIAAVQAVFIFAGFTHNFWRLCDKTRYDLRHDAALSTAYKTHSGMVFCCHQGFAPGARAENLANDLFKLGQMVNAGVVSRDVFLKPIRNREFSMIIMDERDSPRLLFTGYLREAVLKYYTVEHEEYGELFLVPGRQGSS